MIKLDQANNQIVIPLEGVARTKSQRYVLKEMINSGKMLRVLDYIESFKGKRHGVYFGRPSVDGRDELAHKKQGTVLAKYNSYLSTSESHKPNSKHNDWIGVEIECFIPYASVDLDHSGDCSTCDGSGEEFNEDGDSYTCNDCDGSGSCESSESKAHHALSTILRQNKIKFCNVKHDGSIDQDDDTFPVEITVLTRLSNPENLKEVCRILKQLGAKVNKSCGMHVHLDMRHKVESEVIEIGKVFAKALPVLALMVPETRRNNHYCQLRVSTISGERYRAVNLTAFRKYKTLEVRLHSSTTDFNKIMNWANLIDAISKTEVIKKKCFTLNDLTDYVKISEDLLEFFTQRIELFSPKPSNVSSQAMDLDSTEIQIELPEQLTLSNNLTSSDLGTIIQSIPNPNYDFSQLRERIQNLTVNIMTNQAVFGSMAIRVNEDGTTEDVTSEMNQIDTETRGA